MARGSALFVLGRIHRQRAMCRVEQAIRRAGRPASHGVQGRESVGRREPKESVGAVAATCRRRSGGKDASRRVSAAARGVCEHCEGEQFEEENAEKARWNCSSSSSDEKRCPELY